MNIYKAALYSLYYRRALLDRDGIGLIRAFNYHLRAVKRAAEERKSDILNNIWYIPEKNNYVEPFYKILNESHLDTASYRKQDNRNCCFLSDYRKKLMRNHNAPRRQNIILTISREKKQILIKNVFNRVCKDARTTKGNRIELCSNSDYNA